MRGEGGERNGWKKRGGRPASSPSIPARCGREEGEEEDEEEEEEEEEEDDVSEEEEEEEEYFKNSIDPNVSK
jgi:hypothetical protein